MDDFILVINSGSSSLKFAVLANQGEQIVLQGIAEHLGSDEATIRFDDQDESLSYPISPTDHQGALTSIKSWFKQHPKVTNKLTGIGHRVVHGGEVFKSSTIINEKALQAIEDCATLAPLHNPANLKGIRACQDLFPTLPQVAVFDTAFHQSLDKTNFLYPIPMQFYRNQGIRKYGFHGTSFRYISDKLRQIDQTTLHQGVIVAHLGNGASVCAIQEGQSQDTSMGLTPLDGLMMGTRSGSIDPMILGHICQSEGISLTECLSLLNHQSGLLGISELSNDCRTLEGAMQAGDERAQLALDMFASRTAKHIASLTTSLTHFEHLVFTGGIGEHSVYIRQQVCRQLGVLGIRIDPGLNQQLMPGQINVISQPEEAKKVWVIPTNEELMIALDTLNLIQA